MSIRKRTLASGTTCWQIDYRDQQGKRRSRQFKTQKEAKDYETRVRGEIRAGTHVADSASATIAKAGELWLDRCRLEGLEAATIRNYKQHLDLHIVKHIGNVKLSRLSKPDVGNFCHG